MPEYTNAIHLNYTQVRIIYETERRRSYKRIVHRNMGSGIMAGILAYGRFIQYYSVAHDEN